MTDIRLPLNVFAQTAVAGQLAEISAAGPESQTCMVNSSSVATILPAYPVKLITGTSSIPLVDLAVPGTDEMYGVVLANPKVSSWLKGDILQVTCAGSVIHMKSSGSLARGTYVGINSSSYKLQAATGSNAIGLLLDDATTDNLARVQITIPAAFALASGA